MAIEIRTGHVFIGGMDNLDHSHNAGNAYADGGNDGQPPDVRKRACIL